MWGTFFVGCGILDIISHYFHVVATVYQGNESHKNVKPSEPLLLRIFYSSRPAFICTCLGHEFFAVALYVHAYAQPNMFTGVLLKILLAPFVFKTAVHIVQLANAMHNMAKLDVRAE